MSTIINTPAEQETGTGNGVLIGILLVVFIALLFLLFGLPYLRNRGTANPTGASVNVTLPAGNSNTNGGATPAPSQ